MTDAVAERFPPFFGVVETDPGAIYTAHGLRLDRECALALAVSYDALFPNGKPLSATNRRYATDPAAWPAFLDPVQTYWRKIELEFYLKHKGWQ